MYMFESIFLYAIILLVHAGYNSAASSSSARLKEIESHLNDDNYNYGEQDMSVEIPFGEWSPEALLFNNDMSSSEQATMDSDLSRHLYSNQEDQTLEDSSRPTCLLKQYKKSTGIRGGNSSWFANATVQEKEWIAALLAHYWGRRSRTIAKASFVLLEDRLTAEMGRALLDPHTPIETIVRIADEFRPSNEDPYAISIVDMKKHIAKTYGISEKTLHRYCTVAKMQGLEGAPASRIYQYCTTRWNEINGERCIDFGPYEPWLPKINQSK